MSRFRFQEPSSLAIAEILPELDLEEGFLKDDDYPQLEPPQQDWYGVSTQPFYSLRAVAGELVADLCEVRGGEQHIVRASYLRASDIQGLQSLLMHCPGYPIACISTPALRCSEEFVWP